MICIHKRWVLMAGNEVGGNNVMEGDARMETRGYIMHK